MISISTLFGTKRITHSMTFPFSPRCVQSVVGLSLSMSGG